MSERSKLLKKYIKKIKYDDRPLGVSQARRLLMVFMEDYMSYKISIDEVADLCLEIWSEINHKSIVNNSRIEGVYLGAIDLSWELRNAPESAGTTIKVLIEKYNLLKDGKDI